MSGMEPSPFDDLPPIDGRLVFSDDIFIPDEFGFTVVAAAWRDWRKRRRERRERRRSGRARQRAHAPARR